VNTATRRKVQNLAVPFVLLLSASLLMAGAPSPIPAAGLETPSDPGTLPFAVGERLVYRIDWNPPWFLFFMPAIEAGEVTLDLAGEVLYKDTKSLKIVFSALSSGTLMRLFGLKVEDTYEFVTDAQSFCTHTVAKKIREGKHKRDIEVVYLPDSRQLHKREVDVSTVVPRVIRDKNYEDIPPCVKDLFSALYALRREPLKVGSSYRILVGDDEHIREVEAQVEKIEQVKTPSGVYRAWRVNTVAILGGLFKNGGQFRMWLTADERKLPVKFEVQVNLGKATGSLKTARF
jgi:hypothetical protein